LTGQEFRKSNIGGMTRIRNYSDIRKLQPKPAQQKGVSGQPVIVVIP